ncbi:MAG TPA: protein phosphatase 2C domain-containing protein [Acidobacteriota bacterium]|nr:protein phosphatase 2C domain-containing protein [Acidobacteriota bacterium]
MIQLCQKPDDMRAAALSNVGLTRSKNEDAYWCDQERGVFIVADGIGSQLAGEVASGAAVEVISAELTLAVDLGLKDTQLSDAMFESFREAAEEIFNRSKESEDYSGMACSAIAAVFQDGNCVLAHAGDSRAYLFSENSLHQITVDDTPVAVLVKRGYLLPEKARSHHLKNVLTKSIGSKPTVEANLTRFPVKIDEKILLCSDGLWAMLSLEEMNEILRENPEPEEACRELIAAARSHGGQDNITAILIQMDESGSVSLQESSAEEVHRYSFETDI